MTKFKIVFDKNNCIGSGGCESAYPEIFKVREDNKAELIGGKEIKPGIFSIVVEAENREKAQEAVASCPVNVIKIEDVD